MIATCLAYLWVVCLGALVVVRGWLPQIHRTDRCDLSLFQIGLLWIKHCLNEGLPLLVPLRHLLLHKSAWILGSAERSEIPSDSRFRCASPALSALPYSWEVV